MQPYQAPNPHPTQPQQFNLQGLSVPENNPYKKMSRQRLIESLKKLESKNKQLVTRLAFLEPQKQKEPICGTEEKRKKLFEEFQVKKFCLRIAYIGITYNGFILQCSTDNTVEYFLFKSLYACNLIPEKEPGESYTRAGRTDRGVSAFGNVIALNLRTSIPKNRNQQGQAEQPIANTLDYCKMLNANLPTDIRILSCQVVPDDFNARYWCTSREYKYFFLKSFLDLERMEEAIKQFQGTHNFINFCRIDVVATTNHERTIKKSRIQKFTEWQGANGDFRNEIYYFHFIGNAFLWHQIRFMATILFLVGSHKEQPSIIKQLLDTNLFPRKPNYPISPEYPLILENCRYQKHEFEVKQSDVLDFYNSFVETLIKRTIDLNLYINCISNIQASIYKDLKIDNKELTKLCIEEESKIFKTKAKKKLSLQKTSCINVQESIDKLTGKRLDFFERRMEKQAAYEERVKAETNKEGE